MEADNALNARLDALATVTAEVREELVRENIKRDKRIRTNRMAMIVLSVVAVIGVAVGFSGKQDAHAAKRELHIANAQTEASRKASCEQYNRQQDAAITFAEHHDQVLADQIAPPPRSPQDEIAVDQALAALNQDSIDGHQHRDCSPAGIAAYLNLTTTKGH